MQNQERVNNYIAQHSSELIVRKGLPKSHLYGEIRDDPSNREFFYFPHKISEICHINFIQLATIWFYESHRGIRKVLDKIPKSNPERVEAFRYYEQLVLATAFRPRTPRTDKVEIFLEDFAQGAYLKVGPRYFSNNDVTKEKYPKTFRCASISGLSFEKLGIIRHALGLRAVKRFFSALPKQDKYEKCIVLL